MSPAPWRSPLAHALHRNRSLVYSRYVQLATVGPEGRPANRTVVFRGFLEESNQLKVIVDSRSQKVGQIEAFPWGEICWYFATTREQFRIAGHLTLVQQDHPDRHLLHARQQQWQELSDAARSQFAWAQPASPREGREGFDVTVPDSTVPLPNFCLLLIQPDRVDHLELRGEPQNRWIYELKEDCWTVRSVYP